MNLIKNITFLLILSCNKNLIDLEKGFKEDILFYSIFENNFEKFKLYFQQLKQQGKDYRKVRDNLGNTLLHVSVENNLKEFYSYLLEEGLEASISNNKNKFPENVTEDLELKIKLKNLRNFEELSKNIISCNYEVVEFLILRIKEETLPSDINILNICLASAANGASLEIHKNIFEILVKNYPSFINKVSQKSNNIYSIDMPNMIINGKSPFDILIDLIKENDSFIPFAEILRKYNPDLNSKDIFRKKEI